MEAHLPSVTVVVDAEEEPLCASGGIDILLQQQVVLMLKLAPAGHCQVAALEPALKHQLGVALGLDGRMQSGLGVKGLEACEGVVIGVGVVAIVGLVDGLREE